MNSTVALLVNIPTLFLLYVIIYFTQSLSGKRQFYGVSLNGDYFTKDEFKKLDKQFKLLVTLGFVIFEIIALISIYMFSAYNFVSLFPPLGFCLYQFIVYVYVHNKVKTLKSELALNISDLDIAKTKVILDTDFINEKNRIIQKFSILFTVPLFILLLIGVYVLTKYNSIPDIIPIHWGFSGAPDDFIEKTFISVLGQICMMIGLGLIIYVSSIYSLKSRAKLSVDNIEDSKKANLYYLNRFGLTFLILNIACQIMFINILLSMSTASSVNIFIIGPCTILIIVTAIYQTYLYYKSPSKSKDAVYSVDDDDSTWLFGCIYNNPNDPSFFVQKRFGVGWTVNIGTTKGKLFFILPFIIVALTLLFI